VTASRTLLGLGVMSPRSVSMASGRLHSRGSPVTAEDCQGWGSCKMNKAVVEMTSNFNLGVDEDDNEELLEAVPEELTNEKLLELEQECIATEEAREKKTAVE